MSIEQPKNPLHGVTLAALLRTLVDELGWEELARRVPIPPFLREPTFESSLKFLRRHPEERAAVEALYLATRPPIG
ncbi:MAG: DUF2132 domain-containing protein [Myxococcales bacterium]|nr:DUF2132 domain-containing protein [Myxococcales bacterium]